MNKELEELGKRIYAFREKYRMTRDGFSVKSGVSTATIYLLETGTYKAKTISARTIEKINRALEAPSKEPTETNLYSAEDLAMENWTPTKALNYLACMACYDENGALVEGESLEDAYPELFSILRRAIGRPIRKPRGN